MFSSIDDLKVWYNDIFKQSKLYLDMQNCVENSPWHREANVGVHTDMVFEQYCLMMPEITTDYSTWPASVDILAGIAVLFHDVGKPSCKTEKFKPERGTYYSFNGHESKSARMFEDYACLHLTDKLSSSDINLVCYMIEHHLPWSVKKADKYQKLVDGIHVVGAQHAFVRFLMSDQLGRTSDDSTTKIAEAQLWCDNFVNASISLSMRNIELSFNRVLYMPIGPSGVGKSTIYKELNEQGYNGNLRLFSMDNLRLDWYDDDYATAWQMSVDDNTFKQDVWKHFTDTISYTHASLYCDNTNLTVKSRRQYIDFARRRGYTVIGIDIICDLQTVIDRQSTRGDKCVPKEAVMRQYWCKQSPSYGEFDEVWVHCHCINSDNEDIS